MSDGHPIEILLVEDNPADVRLTVEALKTARVRNRMRVVEDGEQALEVLRDSTQARPDLILLDLNLPGIDGREVLRQVKADPELSVIPVCILTTSKAEEDVLRAYQNHTNCYIVKPLDLHQFVRVVEQIEEFWFTVVRLPPSRPKTPEVA